MRVLILFLLFTLSWACTPSTPLPDLYAEAWIHGSPDCSTNTDPLIQVLQYDQDTWILRQNKCTNYEAPFMFLFFGKDRALLMDTGATEGQDSFPLYETVKKIMLARSKASASLPLVVAHTHKHGDHYAADGQFKGKSNVDLVGLEVEDVQAFFGINNWPNEPVDFDLGGRNLTIIPIPGHQAASIAVYDPATQILLTGDSFYPGRLYVGDWPAFRQSIKRLVDFTGTQEISYILGNHIEMSQTPGQDYPMGTTYQPQELALPLNTSDLDVLAKALEELGDSPQKAVYDRFIIYPVDW